MADAFAPAAQTRWPLLLAPARWARRRHRNKDGLWALGFLLPFYIGLVFFVIGPLVASVLIGFTNWNLLGSPQWVGLANYTALFRDPAFIESWKNTAYYILVSVPASMLLGFLLALLMSRNLRGGALFRVLFFLPMTIGIVASGLLWSWMFEPHYGVINYILHYVGIGPVPWLTSSLTAMPSVIMVGVWRGLGFNIIVFLAGLQAVPVELYDAATVDGAGAWRRTVSVTIPMLSPTLFFAWIIGVILSFQVFEQTYVMTQGGPGNSTLTIIYYIYLQGFSYLHMGYASAASVTFIVALLILTAVMLRYQDKWVHYEG